MENYYVLIKNGIDDLNSSARMVADFVYDTFCQMFHDRPTNTLRITTKDGFQLSLNNTSICFHDHPIYSYGIAQINIGGDVLTFARVKKFTKEKPSSRNGYTNSVKVRICIMEACIITVTVTVDIAADITDINNTREGVKPSRIFSIKGEQYKHLFMKQSNRHKLTER